jgi:hypothetical protein
MYVEPNTNALSRKHCYFGKAISISYTECVFGALVIQHEERMRSIVECTRPALQYFSTLSHKRHDFRKTVIEYKICVSIFSVTFV